MARVLTEETSLTLKRRKLGVESHVLGRVVLFEAVLAASLIAVGAAWFFLRQSSTLLWCGVVAGVFAIAHRMKIRENQVEEKRVAAGQKGEADVISLLNDALDKSHYMLNDFILRVGSKSAQIDHLIVSPNGIFVIETKNWRGRIEGDAREPNWRQFKDDGTPVKVSNPIFQNERHVEVVQQFLKRAGITWPDVMGVIVFRSTRTLFDVTNQSMPVLYPRDAASCIANHHASRIYQEQEVDAVINALMREAR